jgi:hypothetical protein
MYFTISQWFYLNLWLVWSLTNQIHSINFWGGGRVETWNMVDDHTFFYFNGNNPPSANTFLSWFIFIFTLLYSVQYTVGYNDICRKLLHKVIEVISYYFDADTFFHRSLFQLLQRIRNQHKILRFLIPIFYFWKNNFFDHIGTFCELWSQLRTNRLKKTKNVFCKCVLELSFATITGIGKQSC